MYEFLKVQCFNY